MTTDHVEQPMPIPNGRPSIQSLVRADLDAREQVGVERYGTPLQAFNGRDALRDAYEEALDLACYLRQAMVERDIAPDAPPVDASVVTLVRPWNWGVRIGRAITKNPRQDLTASVMDEIDRWRLRSRPAGA